ncbi:hypothetical protein [Streptomyces sp. NPDC006012]|uniref:hypothetical protein n=1 Tax=Streptomyces sp. NPDC006012 TaxID=3364739 RepID=UPI003675373F
MPIPQELAQGQEHQEQEQRSPEKLHRRREQLQRLLGQLQKLLRQREDSLERRKEWSGLLPEATPDGRRQGLEVQRSERGRQQGMRYLSERMLELAGELLTYVAPEVTDVPQLGATQKEFEEVDQREAEQLKQEIEEHSEHREEGPLPGSEQEQLLPHELRERMYGAGKKVQAQIDDLKQSNDRSERPVHSEVQRLAEQLGYVPSALANAIQGHSGINSSVASAAADYSSGVNSRQSSSPAPRPETAAPVSTTTVGASRVEKRRSR